MISAFILINLAIFWHYKCCKVEKKDQRRSNREAWTENRTPHKTKDFLSPQDPCQRKVCCKLGFASSEGCIKNGHYKLSKIHFPKFSFWQSSTGNSWEIWFWDTKIFEGCWEEGQKHPEPGACDLWRVGKKQTVNLIWNHLLTKEDTAGFLDKVPPIFPTFPQSPLISLMFPNVP